MRTNVYIPTSMPTFSPMHAQTSALSLTACRRRIRCRNNHAMTDSLTLQQVHHIHTHFPQKLFTKCLTLIPAAVSLLTCTRRSLRLLGAVFLAHTHMHETPLTMHRPHCASDVQLTSSPAATSRPTEPSTSPEQLYATQLTGEVSGHTATTRQELQVSEASQQPSGSPNAQIAREQQQCPRTRRYLPVHGHTAQCARTLSTPHTQPTHSPNTTRHAYKTASLTSAHIRKTLTPSYTLCENVTATPEGKPAIAPTRGESRRSTFQCTCN